MANTRREVHRDANVIVYEVVDDAGQVVGTDSTPAPGSEADNQRSTVDALRQRRQQLRDDVTAMQAGNLTLTQLQRVVERNTRATLLLIRLQLGDLGGAGE